MAIGKRHDEPDAVAEAPTDPAPISAPVAAPEKKKLTPEQRIDRIETILRAQGHDV